MKKRKDLPKSTSSLSEWQYDWCTHTGIRVKKISTIIIIMYLAGLPLMSMY